MEFEVLPGPSLPERARTVLARAASATVSVVSVPSPGSTSSFGPTGAGQVPCRAARDGSPVLLPVAGSPLAQWLAESPGPLRVSLPAGAPFSVLRLTGTARLVQAADTGITACLLTVQSIEFTGASRAWVPVDDYRAAAPDPLWRVAPGVLHHLEHSHMPDLVHCVRAHGMARAEWVIPRGLDRYGLELLVLTKDGITSVRLSVPSGPVSSLDDVPVSLRAALTCRCQAGPDHAAGPDRAA
jgi:hypothetical protein